MPNLRKLADAFKVKNKQCDSRVMDLPAKILLTTSRNPTPRIRTFCHDFTRVIPNAVYVNRGKMSNDEVAEKALECNADRVVVVDRHQGGPGVLRLFKVGESGLASTPPSIHVAVIKLQRDFGASGVKPASSINIAVHKEFDDLVRLGNALSDFLGISILETKEMMKSGSTILGISPDKSGKIAMTFVTEPNHFEVGPHILISRVDW